MNLKLFLKDRLPMPVVKTIQDIRFARKVSRASEAGEPDLRIVKYLASEKDVVVDIGANIGYYTKFLSDRVGEQGGVYSVEPVSATFERLSYIVRRLNLRNVTLINCALSDRDGKARMEIPVTASGEENFFEAKIVPDEEPRSEHSVMVRLRRLDSLISQQPRPVTFIKCDVEGHEFECLKGADGILRQSRPALLVEIWGNPYGQGLHARRTRELLESYGYRAFWFDGGRLRDGAAATASTNYFFLLPHHISALKEQGVEFAEGH